MFRSISHMYLQNTYIKGKFLASAILHNHVAAKAVQELQSLF